MTDTLVIENPTETIARLEAEHAQATAFLQARLERLEDFAERVYELTSATQPEIAYKTCETLLSLARQVRVTECPKGCKGPHYVERWAAIKNVSPRTVYRWMDEGGLGFTKSESVRGVSDQFKRRLISHEQMEAFEACQ